MSGRAVAVSSAVARPGLRGARAVALGVVLLATSLPYASVLQRGFFGADTWPWLVSTHLNGLGDVLRLISTPIMSGTNFVSEVAVFYHPVTALTYALDQALFGLNPLAFYATNIALHLAAVAAVYSLARGLGAAWWAACATAIPFGLHPVAWAAVQGLPRRQDLVVAALLACSMSLLARLDIENPKSRRLVLGAALLLYLLALGGKEVAFAALPIVPLVPIAALLRHGTSDLRRVLRTTALITLAFLVLEAVAFAVRWRILGGLGGYVGPPYLRDELEGLIELIVRPYLTFMLWPVQSAMPDRLRDWLLVLGVIAVIVGLGVARLSQAYRWMALVGVVWQLTFLVLYGLVRSSVGAYLEYVPLVGLALLVGALIGGVGEWLSRRPTPTRSSAGIAASGGAASVFLIAVVLAVPRNASAPDFDDASRITSEFLAQALPCIAAAPVGTTVSIDGLPHRIAYDTPNSKLVEAYMFEPYSLESVIRLLSPTIRARVEVQSLLDVQSRPSGISVSCQRSDQNWKVVTRLE